MNPAPMPWIGCGLGWPPLITAEADGSTANHLEPGPLLLQHHRQPDAGVARGRLDDRAAGLQDAAAFGVFDHRQRDAVLDRAAWVGAFGPDPHLAAGAEQPVDADVRRVADGGEDVVGFHEQISPLTARTG